jgi:hypothetical protein
MDPKERQLAVARTALPALVARMGGEVTITEQELEELGRPFGGFANMAVQVEQRGAAFHFKVIRNPATLGGAGADPEAGPAASDS